MPNAGLLFWASCLLLGACEAPTQPAGPVRPGIEVLLSDSLHLIAGRTVGLITNPTGRARDGRSSIDLLRAEPRVRLAALFAPEHGLRGREAPGERVEDGRDPRSGLVVHSLYGTHRKPTPEMLRGLEALLFDVQDVGARYFTYASTMGLAMEAAAEAGIPFLVLDRPNPIGGVAVQGNVLDPAYSSFVGLYPVPMRHGMTLGELALFIRHERKLPVRLHVVPADGWHRDRWFDETGLPWIPPSPNLPSLESVLHYPGTCLFEGTNLSVGRGTELAFQAVGAPWLDGPALARRLNDRGLPGVRFEAVEFVPREPGDGKYPDRAVRGVRFVLLDRATYDPTVAGVAALLEARRLAGDRWAWSADHFDRLAGTNRLRLAIEAGEPLEHIVAGWEEGLRAFRRLREKSLIYR